MMDPIFKNPFRPGAGHMPPFLAGRAEEQKEFGRLLQQDVILENLVLTGLRGVGKTVLLETFKPLAVEQGWLWVGTDLSESSSVSEENLAVRIITDLAVVTSGIIVAEEEWPKFGLTRDKVRIRQTLDYHMLIRVYQDTPGLVADKLKTVLELAHQYIATLGKRGVVFAYDEAQNLADHAAKDQYPLSLLLDVFQSLQRKEIPFMLALSGLPTLFPKLVEARTFAERMFRVVFVDSLSDDDSELAIVNPIEEEGSPVRFNSQSVRRIVKVSGGYPYFIQFICREVYDLFIQSVRDNHSIPDMPIDSILRKLDSDFFAGRWAKATDRQRDLLVVIASLENHDKEFTVHEVVEMSRQILEKAFTSSHANQMLVSLCAAGLIYKNRHGKYSFAVPLLGDFIQRQQQND